MVATKGLAREWPVQAGPGGNWGMKQTEYRTVITVTQPRFSLNLLQLASRHPGWLGKTVLDVAQLTLLCCHCGGLLRTRAGAGADQSAEDAPLTQLNL